MARDKQSQFQKVQRDFTFYYEVIGIICIILPILGISRLGIVGFYIMLIFKIGFGDWYFLILITIFAYGLRCLIYHKPLDLKRMRIIGIVLILLGIMILSHFPMHKYISNFDEVNGSYYRKTISLYLDYFKNYYDGIVVGGGIIGASFFYLFYTLLSSIGTWFMIFVLIFIGVVFFTEKTINEFIKVLFQGIIRLLKGIKNRFKSFKYDIVVKTPKSKLLKYHDLTPFIPIKYEVQELKQANYYKEELANILNNMNVFYNEVIVKVSYNVTSLVINTKAYIDLEKLNSKLKNLLGEIFLIKKDLKTSKIIVEINNIYETTLNIKTMYPKEVEYDNKLLIGYDSLHNMVYIDMENDTNLLIENYLKSSFFIEALITLFHLKYKESNIYLVNIKSLYNEFNITLKEFKEILSNKLINKEANKKSLIIINYDDLEIEELLYLLQISKESSILIVTLCTNKAKIDKVVINYFNICLYFKDSNSLDISKKLKASEVFLIKEHELIRMSYISLLQEEQNKIKS